MGPSGLLGPDYLAWVDRVIAKFKERRNDVVEQYDIWHEGEIALSLHVISAGNRAPMGYSAPMKFGIFNRYVIERDDYGKAASSWCDCSWERVSRREGPQFIPKPKGDKDNADIKCLDKITRCCFNFRRHRMP